MTIDLICLIREQQDWVWALKTDKTKSKLVPRGEYFIAPLSSFKHESFFICTDSHLNRFFSSHYIN